MKNTNAILVFIALFLMAVLSRTVPHFWNFTIIGGTFLFAGAYFKDKKIAAALMLSVMLASDAIIGFHNQMLSVYFAYLLVLVLGFWLKTKDSRIKILGFSVAGSLVFYIITNLAVWYEGKLYSVDFSGLVTCFAMALPFYRNQLIGDVLSAVVLFEAAKFAMSYSEAKQKA